MANLTSTKAAFALSIAAFCAALLVLGAGTLWLYTLPENAGGGGGGFVIIGQLLLLELIFSVLTFVSFLSAAFAAIVLRKARWLLMVIAPFAALAIWLSFFMKVQRTVDLYGPSDVPALIQSLSSDKKRESSITVLAHLGKAAAPAVGDALHHGDRNVRLGSAQVLRDMCDHARAAIPQLVEATHDGDWEVRAMVAEALGHKGMTVIDATVQLRRRAGIAVAYRGRGPDLYLLQLGNQLAHGSSGHNWIYTINGHLGNRSAGVQILQADDELEWRFAPWRAAARK